MFITEADVSVLVPSYRRPQMTKAAVECACETNAGEILVSDDASNDGTVEAVRTIRDDRIRVIVQPVNLGLWRNHLALLREASRPWIKFLQNDDRLVRGGLHKLVAAVGPQTSVVASLGLVEDYSTKRTRRTFELQGMRRWTSDEYMERLLVVGNEMGTPTDTLFRSDVLERSEEAWSNSKSCDLICNVLAASRGEVVLLPPGTTITVDHLDRDSHAGSLAISHGRLVNTVKYLARSPDRRVRRFAQVFGFVEGIGTIGHLAGALRRRRPIYDGFGQNLATLMRESCSPTLVHDARFVRRMLMLKFGFRRGKFLDFI